MSAKKVIFLYPYDYIEQELIKDIVQSQYEAFSINDHVVARDIITNLKDYNNSILLLNFNKRLKNNMWPHYIESIVSNPVTQNVLVKGFTYQAKEAHDKTLHDYLLPCQLDNSPFNYQKIKKIVFDLLEKHQARGKRQYIRIKCDNKYQASCSVKYKNALFLGEIKDISTVGMACVFYENTNLIAGSIVNDLQIRLNGKILKCTGKLYGIRESLNNLHILLFDDKNRKIDEFVSNFVYRSLQEDMKSIIKQYPLQ